MLPLGSVSLITDCCLLQHEITSNLYDTVSYKLNASIHKPNKAQLPETERNIAINGEVVYDLRKMLVQRSEDSFYSLKR